MQYVVVTLLLCSAAMSLLALFYMAVTPLLAKRYSVTGRYYAWLVIVIGLIIPYRPRFDHAIVKVDMTGNSAMPVIRVGRGISAAVSVPDALPSAVPGISWWLIAAAVWMAGMTLFLACHIIRHYRFLKLTARWSENITDGQTLKLFQKLKTQMGLTKEIELQFCDSIGTPMMTGFIRPRILLPRVDFEKDELSFILKHELVHYKRKDLWYKSLVLAAAAVHWFNPVIHLMAKVIDIQCELSCDGEVVRNTAAETRRYYSETIIGVVRYQSRQKTVLSTNFYGGKNGMKRRIFSIMDMREKKAGAVVLCGALILTLGTGFTFAAHAGTQRPVLRKDNAIVVTPGIAVDSFIPSPDTYAPYAAFGITISADGKELLYEGQPVRQFVDEKADGWAFYLDDAGSFNLSAVRNAAGEITGIERITAQKAQEYYEDFFAEELNSSLPTVQDIATVQENVQSGPGKYEKYQPFGITYSPTDEGLYFNGQSVKFFIDQPVGGGAEALWTDKAGTVSLEAVRDASGQITGIKSISDEEAREYLSGIDEYEKHALNGLDERVEAKVNAYYERGIDD